MAGTAPTGSQPKVAKPPAAAVSPAPAPTPSKRPSPRKPGPRRGPGAKGPGSRGSPAPKRNPAHPSPKPLPKPPAPPAPPPPPEEIHPGEAGAEVIDIKTPQPTGGIQPKAGPVSKPSLGKGDFATALLFALMVTNGFTSGQFKSIMQTITTKGTDTKTSHHNFLVLGGEIVFIIGLSMIAGISDEAATAVIWFAFAMWLLWGVQHGKSIASFVGKVKA